MMSILHLNIVLCRTTYLGLKILVKCEYKTVSHFGLLQTVFSILKAAPMTLRGSRKQIKSLPLVDGATSMKKFNFLFENLFFSKPYTSYIVILYGLKNS